MKTQLAIKPEEVTTLLRRVIQGDAAIYVLGMTWNDVFAGNVTYNIDGWTRTFFNDCDCLDYTDKVVAPDGRTWEYDRWGRDAAHEGPWDPVLRLKEHGQVALKSILKHATARPTSS